MAEKGMDKLLRPLLIPGAAALLAAAGPPRQPIEPWRLDYGDTACTAMRTYGSKAAPVALAFRPSPGGAVVRLIVIRPGKVSKAEHFAVTTNISEASARTTGLRFSPKGSGSEYVWIDLVPADLERLRRAGMISVKGSGAIDERFAVPGIGAVLDRLNACNADLRDYWNYAGAGVARPAVPLKPIQEWFSSDDYPDQAFSEWKGGATAVVMMVDETGKVKDCMVEKASGIATLDGMSCILLVARARFNPALDAAGKPVRSLVTTQIRWVMPE